MDYQPGKFSDRARQPIGKAIWEFLNSPENKIRMETAVELRKPPAEALAKVLVERFGREIEEHRIRQMIGHMIRQVMEHLGYQLQTQSRKVGNKRLFTRAATYVEGAMLTTRLGYINRNAQKNCGSQGLDTRMVYEMECTRCSCRYGCSCSNLHNCRCPQCQNGIGDGLSQ
jgi:hypothetical protein